MGGQTQRRRQRELLTEFRRRLLLDWASDDLERDPGRRAHDIDYEYKDVLYSRVTASLYRYIFVSANAV